MRRCQQTQESTVGKRNHSRHDDFPRGGLEENEALQVQHKDLQNKERSDKAMMHYQAAAQEMLTIRAKGRPTPRFM